MSGVFYAPVKFLSVLHGSGQSLMVEETGGSKENNWLTKTFLNVGSDQAEL